MKVVIRFPSLFLLLILFFTIGFLAGGYVLIANQNALSAKALVRIGDYLVNLYSGTKLNKEVKEIVKTNKKKIIESKDQIKKSLVEKASNTKKAISNELDKGNKNKRKPRLSDEIDTSREVL